ncbi:probable BOI-related E3 ubiquitin-protein ligase 3 [Cornus florida]|uniref:probable BOI-related E3 ubiquitin-protein ligase 3 n=1 Tax=Cornus florida TaxID=4283 RepID=UPI0028A272BF|nr:probable BOI-related E3 ubiquitin-protein ligase 3 [Cornus florida]
MMFSIYLLQKRAGLACNKLSESSLHQSQMFFNNGVDINSRKRKKEVSDTSLPASLINQSPSQQPPQHFTPVLSFTSLLTDDFSANIQEQSDQIEQIANSPLQADQLRRTLAEKWQRHYSTLMCAAEERASKRLKERGAELERTVRRNKELELCAAQYRMEAQVWKAQTEILEERVASLRESLVEATMSRGGVEVGRGCASGEAEDAESSYVDPERVEPVRLACKACGKRVATVMIWPCRHMSVCRRCNAVTKACPACLCLKTASIEVSLP